MTDRSAEHVTIVEVAPRDGLQNEHFVPTVAKIALVDRISACGFERIEVTSFVDPNRVPQMADAAAVMAGIARRPATHYTALVPNMRGFDRALAAGVDEIAVFTSASETFSHHNTNCSTAESIERFRPVAQACQAHGIPLRGYISCVVDCPHEGAVPPHDVAGIAQQLGALGCFEISLGDTIGHGTPEAVDRMLRAVLEELPAEKLAGHFHDTSGRALDNIAVSLSRGIRVFDASVGGLGGCPFAPGAKGNVDTLSVNRFLGAQGYTTGLDQDRLEEAADFARTLRRDGGAAHDA